MPGQPCWFIHGVKTMAEPMRQRLSNTGVAAGTAGTAFAPEGNDTAAAAWRVTVSADTTNGALQVVFTGELNKTVRAVARIFATEVTS